MSDLGLCAFEVSSVSSEIGMSANRLASLFGCVVGRPGLFGFSRSEGV